MLELFADPQQVVFYIASVAARLWHSPPPAPRDKAHLSRRPAR